MKIATNITSDHVDGITRSNVAFIDYIGHLNNEVVAIEFMTKRTLQESCISRNFSMDWFHHYIINTHDLSIQDLIKKTDNLRELERAFRPAIQAVKDSLRKEKPDLVFINGTYYLPWIISIAAHELKIPIVLRYAGVYTKETYHAFPKARKIFSQIEKSFHKRVNYFIFPSKLCQSVVEKEVIGKKISRAFVVPNPFLIPENQPVFKSVERRIAAVGRWDPVKNFSQFFNIHKTLNKEGWAHEATFVTRTSKIKRFPSTIRRLSPMTHHELLHFYTSQGLIISPSHFETFGNVPMEALCVGVPVLVSKNMGCAEILINAGLGNMVVDFSDTKLVLERVKQLCGQQILPKQINNLRKILNPDVINSEIVSIMRAAIEFNGKNI